MINVLFVHLLTLLDYKLFYGEGAYPCQYFILSIWNTAWSLIVH